ncbi:MAG: methylmalonyl-CoA mutase [Chloroflexi bacterium]|nr:methylmalonyl-CoA mutase [Chloroflexota bacterium]
MSAPRPAATERPVVTDSGITIEPVYRAAERAPEPDPGQYPYTRGIHPLMYRGRRWTMRQYAGFATAEESNARYKLLLERGQTGLSVAFDLPTQMGYDSDHPLARPEVGRVGVAIDTLDDMRRLFAGIPLDRVTTSMTINAPAAILLLMYQLVAEEGGADPRRLGGTIQNDILKEYVARGTYIYPPRPSMRLITDTFAYCHDQLPAWNTISISGYHIREAGCSAAQEIAFTLGHAIAYVEAARAAGLGVDDVGPRLSFFFGAHSNLLEEVAKFRAARRLWARLMHDRFGARDPKSQMLRFHTQTCGVTLTAQQPLTNVVRVALQALSAVLGGTQSLHTNSFDEALALPTEAAATLALRTQQVIAEETGIADSADPLAGSYLIEALTDALEAQAHALMATVDALGGAVAAIESGYEQAQIHENAYRLQTEIERGERVIVGVNKYTDDTSAVPPLQRLDQVAIAAHIARLDAYRQARDTPAALAALDRLRQAAGSPDNLLPVIRAALLADCTLGEICFALRDVWGEYTPPY